MKTMKAKRNKAAAASKENTPAEIRPGVEIKTGLLDLGGDGLSRPVAGETAQEAVMDAPGGKSGDMAAVVQVGDADQVIKLTPNEYRSVLEERKRLAVLQMPVKWYSVHAGLDSIAYQVRCHGQLLDDITEKLSENVLCRRDEVKRLSDQLAGIYFALDNLADVIEGQPEKWFPEIRERMQQAE